MAGTGTLYDILANGHMDKVLTGSPQTTFWRQTFKCPTRFAMETVHQPFNTMVAAGTESQILLNRVGDMIYYTYLHVTLPGIVACDSTAPECAGISRGGGWSTFMDGNNACNACKNADESALVEYLDSSFNDMTVEQQIAELKTAKNKWLRATYGAATELACCTEGDSDCPSVVCSELGEFWCHWTNDIGHMMLEKVSLNIGGQEVDRLTGMYLFIWEELSGKAGRRLTEMVGKRYTRSQLCCDSRVKRDLYIPLPFWFTQNSGSALPLASLQFHGVNLIVHWESLTKLIVVSDSKVAVKNTETGLALTANDIRAVMETSYVYLDTVERDRFANSTFETLIVQTQSFVTMATSHIVRIPLTFNHPTLELIFAVRRQCQEKCNNWGNLSGIDGRDPIHSAQLLLNTSARFTSKPGSYYRLVQPYQHHSNIPDSFIYMMSFALTPETTTQPTGSLNLSRIDNVDLVLEMQQGLEQEQFTVMVFARNFNLMRFREGVAGAAFQ